MKHRIIISYGLPAIILGLSIAGARLQNTYLIYAMLGLICLFVGLVSFDKINHRVYPVALFAIGLALLYQTTLIGAGLVGTDIHGEYYFYQHSLNGWDISLPNAYNTGIGSTLIAPFLTNVFHIPGYWIYKAIFPFVFALVPVILYLIFKKEFGEKVAFLSVFFFLSMASWSLEMISLPRQMLAEVVFAALLFLIIVSKLRLRYRIPLIAICGVLGIMFHYVTSTIMLFYIMCATGLLLFFKRRVFSVKWLGIILIVIIVSFVGYYGTVASGETLDNITTTISNRLAVILPFLPQAEIYDEAYISPFTENLKDTSIFLPAPQESSSYLTKQESLVKTALGIDFMTSSTMGKLFRIFQYLTQLCIILGCIYCIKNRKQISAEYLSFSIMSVLLVAASLFYPHLSNIVNVTRLYHISLFLLAPACVLGGLVIFRNYKVVALCLLIPYFIFTSGIVFEAFHQEDISRADIPYSIALSHSRVDMTLVPTDNDIAVRDWAVSQDLGKIISDVHGRLLFCEYVWFDWEMDVLAMQIKLDNNTFEQGDIIFLSERNNRTETVTFIPIIGDLALGGMTSGTRVSPSYAEIGLDKVIDKCEVLYQQGDAEIIRVR